MKERGSDKYLNFIKTVMFHGNVVKTSAIAVGFRDALKHVTKTVVAHSNFRTSKFRYSTLTITRSALRNLINTNFIKHKLKPKIR